MSKIIQQNNEKGKSSQVKSCSTDALELLNMGYSPIPILPNSKNPGFKGWQDADCAELIRLWPPNHGIGIRTGENGVNALDIDIYDAVMVDKIKEFLTLFIGNFAYRVGEAPKFLVPMNCPEITRKLISNRYLNPETGKVNAIEILSGGQQYIHTGIHPDTQLPYVWYGELPQRASLPVFNLDLVHALFNHFDKVAIEYGLQLIIPLKKKKSGGSLPETQEEYLYNSRMSITDLLTRFGWTPEKGDHWTRDGKTSGVSGTVKKNTLYCFTSSTVLEPEMTHRPYDIVLAYTYKGDIKAMAEHVAESNAAYIASEFGKTHAPLPPGASVTPLMSVVDANVSKVIEVSSNSILEKYEVTTEYVDGLGKEEFYYNNLIIKNHITTIIAESGAGKTTFLYFHVSAELAKRGLTVWYVDADSPASDHKKMKQFANTYGIKFLIPDVNQGTSVESLLIDITTLTDMQTDLTGFVFFFDTLKKFIDLMSKRSAKDFFVLMRRITKLGGTIVLPGHANKHRHPDGNLIFEGVGDIKSDSDDLIFFEKERKPDGSIDVTTVVDTDRGAKVRGLFKSFSFNISESREITFYDNVIPLLDLSNTGVRKATDEDILDVAEAYLKSRREPVGQAHLVQYTMDKVEGQAGKQRVREIIVKRAMLKGDEKRLGTRFLYTVGKNNSHLYELPEVKERTYPLPPPSLPEITASKSSFPV